MTRPSSDTVHFSASHGSGCCVVRLRRTSGAWVRRVTASTAACWALGPRRLNEWGSVRDEAISDPPWAGAVFVADEDGGAPLLHAMASNSTAARAARAGLRRCRATLDLIGQ